MTPRPAVSVREQEDALGLLPATPPLAYPKGAIIYSESRHTGCLHLVVSGRVAVTRRADGHSVVVDVYGPDEFFGEGALLDVDTLSERALAQENTRVMRWTRSEIENLVLQRPQLGLALMQMLARRSMEFGARLQNCLGRRTAVRVLRSLVRLSERSGSPGASGRVHIAPMSHRMLSEYVGICKEVVAQQMAEFRRQGLLSYCHQEIILMPRAFEVVRRNSGGGTKYQLPELR